VVLSFGDWTLVLTEALRDDKCGKPSLVLDHDTSPVLVAD
jgi:hypothetical protein